MKQMGYDIGRDSLFNILADNALLIINRRRCGPKTTDSRLWAQQYPALLKGAQLTDNESVWMTDITYLRPVEGFVFLALINVNSG
ncbi:MAG: hypothetical protein V4543_15880 [Bacteroidota bacterium]